MLSCPDIFHVTHVLEEMEKLREIHLRDEELLPLSIARFENEDEDIDLKVRTILSIQSSSPSICIST